MFSLIAFASLIAAGIVLARRFALDPAWRGWSLYSILTAGGLRIMIIIGWAWVALLAIQLLRKGAPVCR